MLISSVYAYFLDFSRRRPPPVSDHFVLHQGWSVTRELTVHLGNGTPLLGAFEH